MLDKDAGVATSLLRAQHTVRSLSPDITDIRTKTYCGLRGRFLFSVDTSDILAAEPERFGCSSTCGSSRSRPVYRGNPKGLPRGRV